MKRTTSSPVTILALIMCAFVIAVPARAEYTPAGPVSYYAASQGEGARLLMKHSPILGLNVAVAVRIDGRNAGSFTKGHIYQAYLPPGRHTIRVYRNGGVWVPGQLIVDVQRGQTYAYVLQFNVNRMLYLPEPIKPVTGMY